MTRAEEIEKARSEVDKAVRQQLYQCELRGRSSKEYRQACEETDGQMYRLRELERPQSALEQLREWMSEIEVDSYNGRTVYLMVVGKIKALQSQEAKSDAG